MAKNYTFRGLNMQGCDTYDEAMEKYHLDFPVLKRDLRFEGIDGEDVISPRNMQVIHGTTGAPLGVVGLNYTTMDYPTALEPAAILKEHGARIVGGGCPNNGERAYLVLEGEGSIELSPGDTIVNRYVMLSSHDGTGKVEIRMTPWREKTGTAITTNAAKPLAFKHTRNVAARVGMANKSFKRVNESWDEFSDGVKRMVGVNLSEDEAKQFIAAVLPSAKAEASTKLENIREDIFLIYRDTGIGTRLPKCRGTLFGVVQAFVEWADIKRTVRKSSKRDEESASLDAKLVSDSAKKKQKAWGLALTLAKNKKMSGILGK